MLLLFLFACHNQVPKSSYFINNRYLFLIVLKFAKIKVLIVWYLVKAGLCFQEGALQFWPQKERTTMSSYGRRNSSV